MGLFLLYFFLQIGVAGQAEVRALCQKQFFQLRFVGTVALGALAFSDRSMPALGLLQTLVEVRMAFGTECSLFFHDHPGNTASVSVVAGQTHAVGKRHVVRPPSFRSH